MTLWMRDQDNIEKGREIGYKLGIKEGKIYGFISAYRELNISDDMIVTKLREKLDLSEDEAKAYLLEINEPILSRIEIADMTILEKSQKAYQELQKYRKIGSIDRDYKSELAQAFDEKYAEI